LRIRIKFGHGPHPRKEHVELTISSGAHYLKVGDVVVLNNHLYVVVDVVGSTKLKLRRLWPHDRIWLLTKLLWKRAWKGTLQIWDSTTRRWRKGLRSTGN